VGAPRTQEKRSRDAYGERRPGIGMDKYGFTKPLRGQER